MKRSIYLTLCALFAALLTGCSDEHYETDIAPITVRFDLVDSNGNSYLDKSRADGYFGKDIILEHNDNSCKIEGWEATWTTPNAPNVSNAPISRVIAPHFKGFYVAFTDIEKIGENQYRGSGDCYLCYGDLSGHQDFNDDITVTIPELGKSVVIHLYYRVKMKGNGQVKSIVKLYTVNGKSIRTKTVDMGGYTIDILQVPI